MTYERLMSLATIFILIVMLIGSNYQLVEQREQSERVVRQSEHLMMQVTMLFNRQTELKDSLEASEFERRRLLLLWDNINPRLKLEAEKAVENDHQETPSPLHVY